MSNEFTPGPWDYVEFGSRRGVGLTCFRVERKAWGAIADTSGWTAQDEANARLIAAAPDLLAALEAMVGFETKAEQITGGLERTAEWYIGEANEWNRYLIAAKVALAKARGTS